MVIQGVLREAKAGKDTKEFRGLAAASSAEMPWVLLKGARNAQAYRKFDRIGESTEQMRLGRIQTLTRGCDWLI